MKKVSGETHVVKHPDSLKLINYSGDIKCMASNKLIHIPKFHLRYALSTENEDP